MPYPINGSSRDEYDEEGIIELEETRSISETQPLVNSGDDVRDCFASLDKDDYTNSTPSKAHRIAASTASILCFLLPSFLNPLQISALSSHQGRRLNLSGLRGFACLVVFNGHFGGMYRSKGTSHWVQSIPVFRILFDGHAAVPIFFIISGYVLTRKPVRLMRETQYRAMSQVLASSMLRRAPRLFIPTIASSAVIMVLTAVGAFDKSLSSHEEVKDFLGTGLPPARDSFFTLLYRLYLNLYWLLSAIYPFEINTGQGPYYTYDDHQWSIPVEYFSSIAMLSTLFALSWLRTAWRISFEISVYIYLYMTARGRCAPFVVGLLLAETEAAIHTHHQRFPKKSLNTTLMNKNYSSALDDSVLGQRLLHTACSLSSKSIQILGFVILLLGLILVTSPTHLAVPQHVIPKLLGYIVADPEQWTLFQGANLVLIGVMTTTFIDPLLTNSFALYLGEISFGIYLVHGGVNKSLGYALLPWTLRIATGLSTEVPLDEIWWSTIPTYQVFVAMMLGYVINLVVIIWAADLLWRAVDLPSIELAKWLEKKLMCRSEEEN